MNQNQTESKPPSVEEPRDEGLDETTCSPFEAMLEHPIPRSGPVAMIREAVGRNWSHGFRVHQHGGEFRLFGDEGQKVTLSPDDACWLLEKFRLGASKSDIFRRSIIWANAQVL